MATEHAGAQHAPQHGHQQAGRHPLARDIPDGNPERAVRNLDEIVIIPPDVPGRQIACGEAVAGHFRRCLRQKAVLDSFGQLQVFLEKDLGHQLIMQPGFTESQGRMPGNPQKQGHVGLGKLVLGV